jgi:ABC-type microcin C transport system permease subunit YejB
MIICIVVFTGAVFYAIFARKGFVSKMGSLPLESNLNNSNDEEK